MSDVEDSASDSDDDLLGLTSQYNTLLSTTSSHIPLKLPLPSSPGWSCQSRNNKNNQQSKWADYSNDIDTSIPTMEIIDSRAEMKQNRYQRMREIHNIAGFIVNVHDAINFDIDLEISPDLHEKYCDVVSNQYTYQDLQDDFFENPDLNKKMQGVPKIGITYRCRLRGVGMNQLPQNVHNWKATQMCIEVKQLLDRTDSWVTCTLSDIDVYKRLLVDIIIHTCTGDVNLREYLLSRMQNDENPIFYHYSGKRTFKHY